jgi:ATP-dependent Clp protease adaptor protein ClpS
MQQLHNDTGTKTWEETDISVSEEIIFPFNLIVWNDEVNTFDWVIKSLMEVCGHTEEQAEQCALFIHFKGKYGVKHGDFDTLRPMRDAITERMINATIEETAGA